MADIQAGIGPFLGIFLLAHGWESGLIGTVMSVGGIAGMIMTTPAGAMIDATTNKRTFVIIPGIFTVIASAVILVSQSFWVVAASQVATAIAGAAIVPAVTGITLGIVHQAGFNRQNGRNQAFNHAGNMVGAALSGFSGWQFGFGAVFILAAVFGALSIISVSIIPKKAIDDHVARGSSDDSSREPASAWRVLLECKPLLVLAAALALFHLGNAAMLPLYGLAVVSGQEGNGAGFVAMTIVVAQAVMIVASIVAMRMAGPAHIVSRAAGSRIDRGIGDQILGGVSGAGARRHWRGLAKRSRPGPRGSHSEWHGAGQCRPRCRNDRSRRRSCAKSSDWRVAGARLGYPAAFTILGCFAIGSIVIWLSFASVLKPACVGKPTGDSAAVPVPAS
jgi:MFS family permease